MNAESKYIIKARHNRRKSTSSSSYSAQWHSVLTHTHTHSGCDDSGGTASPLLSYSQLAAWTARLGVNAVGMGSPYTSESAETYKRYDHDPAGEYYRAEFDQIFEQISVKDSANILQMLRNVNRHAAGRTLFYLDNEIPKGRYGHMWWLGFHYDYPAWHDYDQPFDRWTANELQPGDYSDEPMPYKRRPYMEIIAAQRARGAVGCWAHPTSWGWGARKQFITNLATEMPAHAIADGCLNGMVIMGCYPFRPQYQALWFELLDRGYRVPGVAEMDCGLSDPTTSQHDLAMLNLVHNGDKINGDKINTVDQIVQAFSTGHIVASSGPLVEIFVDKVSPGSVATTAAAHRHHVEIRAHAAGGAGSLGRVELLGRGGEVLWACDETPCGTFELEVPGLDQRGYLIARVFGPGESSRGMHWRDVKHIAVSNPVYLHPRGQTFNAPSGTVVTLRFVANSRFLGGQVQFETARGQSLYDGHIREGIIREVLPASGRFTLMTTDGYQQTHYLINANPRLQNLQRYLYRGRFLQDFPELQPGELPPQVWQLDPYAEAMQQVDLTF